MIPQPSNQIKDATLALGFKAAKQHLSYTGSSARRTSVFICNALNIAELENEVTKQIAERCRTIVIDRLEGADTFGIWLRKRYARVLVPQDEQDLRHEWLDSLIKEFTP